MEEKRGFKNFLCSPLGKVCMILVMYAIILSIVMLCINSNSQSVITVVFVICAIFGWKALNRITPDIFLIMPVGGWIVYLLIKAFLSILVGIFVTPFVIAKAIATAVQEDSQ